MNNDISLNDNLSLQIIKNHNNTADQKDIFQNNVCGHQSKFQSSSYLFNQPSLLIDNQPFYESLDIKIRALFNCMCFIKARNQLF